MYKLCSIMNKNHSPMSTLQSTVDRKKDIITSGLISLGLCNSLRGEPLPRCSRLGMHNDNM